jgi:hypothetical protein
MHDTSALTGRVRSCHRSGRSQNMQCSQCEKKRWSEKPKVPCCCPSTPVRRVRTRGVESVRCRGTRMYTGQGMPAARSIESTLHVCHAQLSSRLSCNASFEQTNVHMLSARNAASSAPGGRSSGSTMMGMVNVRSASHRPMKHKAFRSYPQVSLRISLTSSD